MIALILSAASVVVAAGFLISMQYLSRRMDRAEREIEKNVEKMRSYTAILRQQKEET